MLSVVVFLPLLAAVVLLAVPVLPGRAALAVWVAVAAAELAILTGMWLAADLGAGVTGGLAYEQRVPWIPGVGSSYHVGVDGLSLPLLLMTAGVFLAAGIYSLAEDKRPRECSALFLFLLSMSLGVFASLDLLVFFVFFDLSIVGMYFVIAGWGHAGAARAALQFFLYTFLGSLAMLVAFLGLYVAAGTFDMVELARNPPLEGKPVAAGFVLLALSIGLAVKTPTVPFHTWLPPAHTDAPAAGSAVLAAVLLKMGTYGFVRIAMPILPEAWRRYALVFVVVGVVSILYGALVALAQDDLKRMIAYTSVNHMGYVLLGLGAAGVLSGGDAEQARAVAVTGAMTQMVSHGLITAALFLLAGVLYERGHSYDMRRYGGLAGPMPRFAGLFAVGAFASLGIPGFTGFLAEFQIFAGSLATVPVAAAIGVLGILLTAALFLAALQRVFAGPDGELTERIAGVEVSRAGGKAVKTGLRPKLRVDVTPRELAAVAPLLLLALVLGLVPRPLLDLIEPAARTVTELAS